MGGIPVQSKCELKMMGAEVDRGRGDTAYPHQSPYMNRSLISIPVYRKDVGSH